MRLELANQRTILGAINLVYDRGTTATDQLAEAASDDLDNLAQEIGEPQDLLEATDDAPIIRLVNSMLQHAVKERASDIHIEPFEREIRVRFRIDDVLYEPMKPLPRSLQASIASRIKIMGTLDIAEKRLPQDGRIRLKIAGKDYDVRLSTIPVAYGERLVLRLLREADLRPTADFEQESGRPGIRMTDDMRRFFLQCYEEQLGVRLRHQALEQDLTYRQCIEQQAEHLARCILGRDGTYVPLQIER